MLLPAPETQIWSIFLDFDPHLGRLVTNRTWNNFIDFHRLDSVSHGGYFAAGRFLLGMWIDAVGHIFGSDEDIGDDVNVITFLEVRKVHFLVHQRQF